MADYSYVYAPVLNFIETALRYQDSVTKDAAVITAVKFFTREILRENHEKLNEIADSFGEQYVKERRSQASRETLASDMYDTVKLLSSVTEFKTRFTIWKLSEVPKIPQDTFTTLCVKVNEYTDKIDSVMEQCKSVLPSQSVWPPLPQPAKALHRVFITNVPTTEIDSCSKQKLFIERHDSDGGIDHIQQTKSGLVAYMKSPKSAASLANSLKSFPDISASFREEKFFAIAKFVPLATTEDDVVSVNPKLVSAKRFGQSETVKLTFSDADSRNAAIKCGLFIGYTHIKVLPFRQIPKRCFKCQSFDHLAKDCTSTMRCSRCAGSHENSRESSCRSQTVKCALCPEPNNGHPSFSLQCPAVRRAIQKAYPQTRK